MKKMMLMLSAVLGASVMLSGADAKKPAAAPAKEAAPVMKSITLEELTASLPNVLAKIDGKDVTKSQFVNDFLKPQLPGGKMPPMPEDQAKEQIAQFATMAAPMLVKGYVDQLLLEAAAASTGKAVRRRAVEPEVFSGIVKRRVVSVSSRIIHLLRRFYNQNESAFSALFEDQHDRSELVATFLALLELIKGGRVTVSDDGKTVKFNRVKKARTQEVEV